MRIKSFILSIVMALMLFGCAGLLTEESAHLFIQNCNKWTYVSVAHFTEFDENNQPTDYEILDEYNIKGQGIIDIDVPAGMYAITYYNREDRVIEYDSFWIEPGETKTFEYDCNYPEVILQDGDV